MQDRALRSSLLLFVAALLPRLLYLLEMTAGPYFVAPQLDELNFDVLARGFAENGFLGNEVYSRGPLYPYLLAVLYRLFGHDFFLPRLLQCFLGAANAVLVQRIGRRAFGPRAGLLAGAIAAFFPTLIYFDGELLITTLSLFLNLLTLLLFLRWAETPERPGRLAVAGLACGLAALARPNILILTPFFAFWVGWRVYRRAGLGRVRALRAMALLTLVVTATILPATLRNYYVARDPVLISHQGGINFYVGNSPAASGWGAATPRHFPYWTEYEDSVDLFARRQAEIDLGRRLKASEVSSYWSHRARQAILEDPARAGKLFLKKLVLFWNAVEIRNNKYIPYVADEFSVLLRVLLWLLPFGAIAPLALVGLLTRRPDARQGLLLGYLLGYMLSVVLFFIYARYRMPVVPVLILYAADALLRGWDAARARHWRTLLPGCLLLAVATVFVWTDFYGIREEMRRGIAQEHFVAGNAWRIQGRHDKAEEYFRKALALRPEYPDAWRNLGIARLQAGDHAGARQAFLRLLEQQPDDPAVLHHLGLVELESKNPARAEQLWKAALRENPDYAPALLALAELLIDQQRFDQAAPLLERERRLRPASLPGALLLIELRAAQGDPAALQTAIKKATAIDAAAAREKIEALDIDPSAP